MSTKKKTRKKKIKKVKGQLLLPFKVRDERLPKISGLILLMLSLYLFMASLSYLWTWHDDQDIVHRYGWSLLFKSQYDAHNWLGKLGAIVSDSLIFWFIGLPVFGLVWLLALWGWDLTRKLKFQHQKVVVPLAGSMVLLSILLEFLFPNAAFPLGGAIGQTIAEWLTGALGIFGAGTLFIFSALILLVWLFNPDLTGHGMKHFWNGIKTRLTGRPLRQAPAAPRGIQIDEDGSVTVHTPPPVSQTPPPPAPVIDFDVEQSERAARKKKAVQEKTGNKDLDMEVVVSKNNPTIPDEARAAYTSEEDENMAPQELEPYDPTLELPNYQKPPLNLLEDYTSDDFEIDRAELQANKEEIVQTLLHFKIDIDKIKATIGPTVTLYEIIPSKGVRISKIRNLEDDIALSLSALGIRIIAPIPGRGTIGIEVPNKKKQLVGMKEILLSKQFQQTKMELPMALGKTIENEVLVADLSKMPHLLIAGATGQGKSVGINSIIVSLLYKHHPAELKLILIDPKKVELYPYSKLDKHFLGFLPGENESILTDVGKVVNTLNSLTIEMERRYDLLKKAEVRNIKEYNIKFKARKLNPLRGHEFLPYIVLIIDEFADLIMTAGKEIELPLGRLAQLSRAVGIHLIIATQRPSVNIITGVIKANFPARIAFKVASKVDSRTILDRSGAEQLIGKGDMLLSFGSDIRRLQGAFVDTPEVERVINFIAQQPGFPEPFYLPEFHDEDADIDGNGLALADLDPKFDDAARLVVQNQHGSTSMIQRRLKLGYNRAGRIMDQLEALNIVGPSQGSKPREVLFHDMIELEKFLATLHNKN